MVVDVIGQVRFVWTYTCTTSRRVSSTIYAGGTAIASVPDGTASGSDISLDTAGNAVALWAEVRHNAEPSYGAPTTPRARGCGDHPRRSLPARWEPKSSVRD